MRANYLEAAVVRGNWGVSGHCFFVFALDVLNKLYTSTVISNTVFPLLESLNTVILRVKPWSN